MANIIVGQHWRDKDKRRQREGNVRKFEVVSIHDPWIQVKRLETGRLFWFPKVRFGSGRANDSFEQVKEESE